MGKEEDVLSTNVGHKDGLLPGCALQTTVSSTWNYSHNISACPSLFFIRAIYITDHTYTFAAYPIADTCLLKFDVVSNYVCVRRTSYLEDINRKW